MRCHTARRAALREGAGMLDPADRGPLAGHLAQCPRCAAAVALERRITDDLGSLRLQMPMEIDVTRRVAARLSESQPPQRLEVPTWQLGFAAALVLFGVGGLLASLWLLGPEMHSATIQSLQVLASMGRAALSTGSVLIGMLLIPFRLATALLAAVPELARRVEPMAIGSIAVGYAIATTFVVYILGRDVRESPARPEQR